MTAHGQLVREMRRMLRRLGFWKVMSHRTAQEHHASVRHAGVRHRSAPRVLDPFCRTHDVDNLFVVDASFFPSSAAVNPGLTIVAQALRVADHIRRTDLRFRRTPPRRHPRPRSA